MERFPEHMKAADMAGVELEREKLAFEREKHASVVEERDRERRECREEREQSQNLEVEKFKFLIEALNKR